MNAVHRPDPLHYLAWVYTGSLPERNREWVRHNLTRRTWIARHLLRGQLAFVPVYALLVLLLPGSLWLRGATVLLGALLALFYNAVYIVPNRVRRLQKNGLDPELENPAVIRRRAETRRAYEAAYAPTRS
ncbi:DUF5313 family protein [Tsukamurella pseudospumae]|uniref:DUF5313 domain-containing protein n=1 Tax=Tsukamurella pseudospumae TaxID=239498 RepID=A0A137ZY66_9ACTN|nr:DUF5313 family protein [Tsukamurella pseudospumae]KXO98168.1 hypothetical protein AXK61_19205 [Tsukamurella pseudospumae]KXP03148.1 hypothetical protein AXK60_14890 [Tsukamurella pseudospumae]